MNVRVSKCFKEELAWTIDKRLLVYVIVRFAVVFGINSVSNAGRKTVVV